MASFTKANPSPIANGTLYSTLQLAAYKVNPSVAFVDTALSDTATRVMEELGTTAAMFQIKSDGDYAIVIGDGHALNPETLATRVGRVHTGQEGTVAVSGATATFTASSSGATVAVTLLTTLIGL